MRENLKGIAIIGGVNTRKLNKKTIWGVNTLRQNKKDKLIEAYFF